MTFYSLVSINYSNNDSLSDSHTWSRDVVVTQAASQTNYAAVKYMENFFAFSTRNRTKMKS